MTDACCEATIPTLLRLMTASSKLLVPRLTPLFALCGSMLCSGTTEARAMAGSTLAMSSAQVMHSSLAMACII